MINVQNIKRVIASIKGEIAETAHIGFNMGTFAAEACGESLDHSGRGCDWVADIAGHAYVLDTGAPIHQTEGDCFDNIEEIAAGYLGLSEEQAQKMFYDLPGHLDLEKIPMDFAIQMLKVLIVTKEVVWNATLSAEVFYMDKDGMLTNESNPNILYDVLVRVQMEDGRADPIEEHEDLSRDKMLMMVGSIRRRYQLEPEMIFL